MMRMKFDKAEAEDLCNISANILAAMIQQCGQKGFLHTALRIASQLILEDSKLDNGRDDLQIKAIAVVLEGAALQIERLT